MKWQKRVLAGLLVAVMLFTDVIPVFAASTEANLQPTDEIVYTQEVEQSAEVEVQAIPSYGLTISQNGEGSIVCEGEGISNYDEANMKYTIETGSQVTLHIEPAEGSKLQSVLLNDVETELTFAMPDKDSTLVVNFEKNILEEVPEVVPEETPEEVVEEDKLLEENPEDRDLTQNKWGIFTYGAYSNTASVVVKPMDSVEIGCGYTKWRFDVTHNGKTFLGFCAQKGLEVASRGDFPVQELHNDRLKALILGSYGSPYFNKSWYTSVNANQWMDIMHGTMTYAYSGDRVMYNKSGGIHSLSWFTTSQANALANQIYSAFSQSVLDNYRVYVAMTPGALDQNIIWVEYEEPNGNLEIAKSSVKPEITNGNDSYTLANAVYGLYQNGKEVGRTLTDSNGWGIFKGYKKGNYILKEITPPKGYALDPTEYPVTINSSQTTRQEVKDYPQTDPVAVLLGKIDKETNANKPQGSASLEGAEFTFKFYGVQLDTDPAKAGKKPLRTWVMRTNKDGKQLCLIH